MSEPPARDDFVLRQASPDDATSIHDVLCLYAADKLLLPLSPQDVSERINTFIVANCGARFAGCASLRDFGQGLYEVRSLAVVPEFTSRKIGTAMVKKLILGLRWDAGTRVFALTYRSSFFMRLGFKPVDKELFPQKIWLDCSRCPKKDFCDEEALLLDYDAKFSLYGG